MTEDPRAGASYDPGSFRDPMSRVFRIDDGVYRSVVREGRSAWETLRDSEFFQSAVGNGIVVPTKEWKRTDEEIILEHERVPFISYPYEWSFNMLKDAALLQLEILRRSLAEGLVIKDSTPYNIQFIGTSPQFIDIGSFVSYRKGEPWVGYRQFCELYLYPLMLRAYADLPVLPWLRGSLSGIPADAARSVLKGRHTLRKGVLTDVVLPARATRAMQRSDAHLRDDLASAGFNEDLIRKNVDRLSRIVEGLTVTDAESTWSQYAACDHVSTQRGPKAEFVQMVGAQTNHRMVWDLGANDGHFSKILASTAKHVVAMDSDETTIDRLYRGLRGSAFDNILPLVVDMSDPSPGLGWRGRERRRIEDRAKPDLVLLLAVIHHLVIGANLPLRSVMEWVRSLDAEVVFEWVPIDDPMSQRLMTNKRRDEVHADYNDSDFRGYLDRWFRIEAELPIENRTVYRLVPRT